MTKQQAISLLTLISDLYAIINTPDPISPPPASAANGKRAEAATPQPAK